MARRTAEIVAVQEAAAVRDAAAAALAAHREEASAELRGLGGGVRLALDRLEADIAELRNWRDDHWDASNAHLRVNADIATAATTPTPSGALAGSLSAPRQQRLAWATAMHPDVQATTTSSCLTATPSGLVVPQSAMIVTDAPRGTNPQLNLSPRQLGFSDAGSPPSSHPLSLGTGSPAASGPEDDGTGGFGFLLDALQGGLGLPMDHPERVCARSAKIEAPPGPHFAGVAAAERGATAVASLAEWLADSSCPQRGGAAGAMPTRDLIRAAARELVSLANRDVPSDCGYERPCKGMVASNHLQAQGHVEGGTGGPHSYTDGV